MSSVSISAADIQLKSYNYDTQTSREGTETIEVYNEDLNNNTSEQQSVLSNDSDIPDPDYISITVYAYDEPVESGKSDGEESPKGRLQSSISSLSTLLRPQSATGSVHITDDTNMTSPSLTTMITYINQTSSVTLVMTLLEAVVLLLHHQLMERYVLLIVHM